MPPVLDDAELLSEPLAPPVPLPELPDSPEPAPVPLELPKPETVNSCQLL